jgi:biotin-dependent carboxylase-like uncharacterized protein
MKSTLRILDPGTYTTVQDSGRIGFRQFGVPPTGCLDKFAHRVANILIGNPDKAAVLEMTFMGADFEVLRETDLALTGADMPLSVNNRPARPWRKLRVKPGDRVHIGQARSGCRAYLALTGGVDVPPVMGSASSYVGARIGGYAGRPLQRGDIVTGTELELLDDERYLTPDWIPRYATRITLKAIPGPQQRYFSDSLATFFNATFTVSPQADRKGYRLQGPALEIKAGMPKSIISEPCLPGCVQVPEDGQPIILLGEQTVGGYAKIATVISSDLDLIAQAMPGDQIRFETVDIDTAYAMARQQRKRLEMLRQKVVVAPPAQSSARAVWNLDPERYCRRVNRHLNQMRPSLRRIQS